MPCSNRSRVTPIRYKSSFNKMGNSARLYYTLLHGACQGPGLQIALQNAANHRLASGSPRAGATHGAPGLRCRAGGEEGVAQDLGRLAASRRARRPEVGSLLWVAGLARPATAIA